VGATFKRDDGVVLVDGERCVGCGYCVQACPYEARFINADTGKADKCTFCSHRIEAGLLPACVETCVGGARVFGDVNDAKSEIRKRLTAAKGHVKVLKPAERTRPNVFYVGLEDPVQRQFSGLGDSPASAVESHGVRS
jgi:tetrathionate reductase subunit B